MTRVDILNQHFYNDPSIKVCHKACKLQRDKVPSEVDSDSLSVWYKFCDDVDQCLELVNEAKKISRRSLVPSFFLIIIFLLLTIGPSFLDYDFDFRRTNSYIVIGLWIVFHIYVYCRVRNRCKTAFERVSQICEEHSDNDVKFSVLSEKKRYFRFKSAFVHKTYFIKISKQRGLVNPTNAITEGDLWPNLNL